MENPLCDKHTHLHADDNGVEIQHGLPVLAQNVQANVSLEVDIGMVDLLHAFDLWRVMREVLIDSEGEVKETTLVHALIGLDGQSEVENVIGVREGHFHGISEGELMQI